MSDVQQASCECKFNIWQTMHNGGNIWWVKIYSKCHKMASY